MRLIGSLPSQEQAEAFSSYLTQRDLTHEMEGDGESSEVLCWVYDEADTALAKQHLADFLAAPNDPRFHMPLKDSIAYTKPSPKPPKQKKLFYEYEIPRRSSSLLDTPFNTAIIIACILLFFLQSATMRSSSFTPLPAIISSPVNAALMYDYPESFQLLERALHLFDTTTPLSDADFTKEANTLLQYRESIPYWEGLYTETVLFYTNPAHLQAPRAPLFEQIRTGELWRLITPSLLHGNLLHILFNLMWMFILGAQVEKRLGIGRYILLFLLSAALSNTAQYLMTGANFLGISGVVCTLIGFVFIRCQAAPWEGYQLQRSSFQFVFVFIFGLVILQLASFYAEITTGNAIAPGIANTAHVAGLLVGFICGKLPFFGARS